MMLRERCESASVMRIAAVTFVSLLVALLLYHSDESIGNRLFVNDSADYLTDKLEATVRALRARHRTQTRRTQRVTRST